MIQMEATEFIKKIKDLYPGWNPTATQTEALCHKLQQYPITIAEAALMESYEPSKRVAPIDTLLVECRQIVARQNKEAKSVQRAYEIEKEVITDEQFKQLMIDGAANGNPMAIAYCNKHKLEIPIPF